MFAYTTMITHFCYNCKEKAYMSVYKNSITYSDRFLKIK